MPAAAAALVCHLLGTTSRDVQGSEVRVGGQEAVKASVHWFG